MSSFGNAIESWSIRTTGDLSDLQHKLVSGGCARRSPPIKAIPSVVDSAYSSFSGSSCVTDYQAFYHESSLMNDEQISYMDSDYVKAIYNPSATDQIHFQENLGFDNCSSKSYPSERITKLSNSSQVTLGEDHLPLRINNCTSILHFEQSDSNRQSGHHFSHKSKRSPTSTSDLSSPEHKLGRHYIEEDHSPRWVRDSVQGEWNQSCVTSCNREKEDYSQFTSSSFLSSVDNLPKSSNITCIGNENNVPSQVSVLNTDGLEQKDLQTIQQINVKSKLQNPSNAFNSFTDYCPNEGEATKSTRRSLNELVSEKIEVRSGSWKSTQGMDCYNDKETKREGGEDLAHDQVRKEQYRPQSQNMKDLECDTVGQWDIKYKGLHTKNSQTLYNMPGEDLFEQPSKALNRDDLQKVSKTHVRKDATIKPIPLLSQEQELTMPLPSKFYELTSEKITKTSTPMLYHLAGGKNSSLVMLNFNNQSMHQGANKESQTFQRTGKSPTPQVDEPQRPLHKNKSHSQPVDDCSERETFGDLTSSEESFMYDYREKLKVAQKKVLRETSFKRKDLQMSLPVRLKWNAPKRPSIDHVRSCSLSASNEEDKFVQPKKLVDMKEEPEKSISRIGGRKRLTKEQRKLCYSEPEKLDHLGVQSSFSVWNNEGLSEANLHEHHKMNSTDKERMFSSSNLSKTELKQIQHNALVEYMERKATQRPSSVHQSQMRKPPGIKSPAEWKCLANEMSNNDVPKPYYHRRSTGSSSSYDATVTWNDRLLKMSQGESIDSVDKAVNSKNKTFPDQSSSNKKCYSEDTTATISQKNSKSINDPQLPAGHLTSSTSALSSSNHICDSLEASEKNVPWCDNEMRAGAKEPGKSLSITEPNVSIAEHPDCGAVKEEAESISILQQNDVDIATSTHEDGTEIAATSFIHGKNNVNDEASGLESCVEEAPKETLTKPMLKSHAEERYRALVKEITAKDKSLVDVLKPLPVRESAISLMKSLFSVDVSTRERSRNQELNKMNIEVLSKPHSENVLDEKSYCQKQDGECLDDITLLKVELISNINLQLKELCDERELLLCEIHENTKHGTSLEVVVKDVCKPNEYDRYLMFIGDLEKVVSLLFCLSMRLVRVENALSKIDKNTDAEEMQSLKERHNLLSRQREDAKELKDNLDRREQVVTGILAKYLSETRLEDYKHFVRLKTTFLIEQKDLDEKIKFHEEQLESLHSSIPPN